MAWNPGDRVWVSLGSVNGVREGRVDEVKGSSVMVDGCWYHSTQCHASYAKAKVIHDGWMAKYRASQERLKERRLKRKEGGGNG